MAGFEEIIQKAVDDKVVANAVLVAKKRDPAYHYESTFGKLSLEEGSADVQLDTVFWIASCTKLLASIASLQAVERGLITLDEPVSKVLPEFASLEIITGIDATTDTPITVKATKPVTLRQLVTHTSGMGYAMMHPLISQWREAHPLPSPHKRNILKEYHTPLVFEPGTPGEWNYSTGLDWAGIIVERLNGGIRLGEYLEKNVFTPLGMTSSTFRPLQNKEILDRICPRVQRQEDGTLKMDPMINFPIIEPDDDAGGGGLYSTAQDYVKILESILRDDGKILKSETIDEIFRPQLPEHEKLQQKLSTCGIARSMGHDLEGGPEGIRWNHGLAGLIAVDGVPGKAGKGTLWWDGLPRCFWWIDRERGTCGFYGSQLLPASDSQTGKLFAEFQRGIYNEAA